MAAMYENLKNLLFEVEKFLQETLKKESISKSCKEQKQTLVDKLNKLWEDYPQLAPADRDKNKDADIKTEESTHTTGSSNTDETEDPYTDQTIPDVAAQDLKEELFSGFLEKKQKKGTFLVPAKFQKRWCVIKEGVFYYYENKKDKRQKGAFYMADYTFQHAPELTKEANKKELCFELVCPAKRTYQFMASTSEDFEKWQNMVMKGSSVDLIEEDIYEPIEVDEVVEDVPQDNYDDGVVGDVYEVTEDLPVCSSAGETNENEDLTEDDIYEDTAPPESDHPSPPVPSKMAPPVPPSKGNTRGKPPPPPVAAPPPPPPRANRSESHSVDTVDSSLPKLKIVDPKEDFENMYYGKWDFTAETGDELTFKQGEIIHIISKEFDLKSWWIGELKGSFGLVPKAHLIPAYEIISV